MARDDSWPPWRIVVHFELAFDRPRDSADLLRAVATQEDLERYDVSRRQHEDLRLSWLVLRRRRAWLELDLAGFEPQRRIEALGQLALAEQCVVDHRFPGCHATVVAQKVIALAVDAQTDVAPIEHGFLTRLRKDRLQPL